MFSSSPFSSFLLFNFLSTLSLVFSLFLRHLSSSFLSLLSAYPLPYLLFRISPYFPFHSRIIKSCVPYPPITFPLFPSALPSQCSLSHFFLSPYHLKLSLSSLSLLTFPSTIVSLPHLSLIHTFTSLSFASPPLINYTSARQA